jgi:hypothetical protein
MNEAQEEDLGQRILTVVAKNRRGLTIAELAGGWGGFIARERYAFAAAPDSYAFHHFAPQHHIGRRQHLDRATRKTISRLHIGQRFHYLSSITHPPALTGEQC